jgi:hypothetical protein
MKNHECPHISECKQFIQEQDFDWFCLGKISWNQESCFRSNLKGKLNVHKPVDWYGNKLIDRYNKYREIQSEKKA